MPCIQLNVSSKLTDANKTNIKSRLGKAIELLPGKSENWLMVTMQDEVSIYFKGNNDKPAAYVAVGVYGREDGRAFNALTGQICAILGDELGIPADRIYVQYSATQHWGWNGGNF